MPRFTLADLLKDTGQALSARADTLLGMFILPAIAAAILQAAAETAMGGAITPENPGVVIASIAALVIQVPAMAATCRICLEVDGPLDKLGPVDARATRFLGVAVKLFAVMIACALPIGLLSALAPGSGLFVVLLLPVIVLLAARLGLALPAAAIGHEDVSLRRAWTLSKGHSGPLMFALLIILPPSIIMTVIASQVGGLGGQVFDGFAAALFAALPVSYVSLAFNCVMLAIAARAYATLSGRGAANGSASP